MRRIILGLAAVLLATDVLAQQPDSASPARHNYKQQYYPVPSYLPPAFVLVGAYTDFPGGFDGGQSEITLLYLSTKIPYAQAYTHAMRIFMTPSPKRGFGLVGRHTGKPVPLTLSTGDKVSAEYHDGLWSTDPNGEQVMPGGARLHWKTDVAHSLVFKWRDMSVAILASRQTGVTFDELVKVAGGLK